METRTLKLENGTEMAIPKKLAQKWSKKSPDNYLYYYGGKIALMQLEPINATLPDEEKLYNFADCVEYMVKLHNIVHKDSVKFMADIVNAEKSKYKPEVAKADDTTELENMQKFVKANSVDNVEVLKWLLKHKEFPQDRINYYVGLYEQLQTTPAEQPKPAINLPKFKLF